MDFTYISCMILIIKVVPSKVNHRGNWFKTFNVTLLTGKNLWCLVGKYFVNLKNAFLVVSNIRDDRS